MATSYHALLEDAFRQRRNRNPQYSLRAFARDLGLSPTVLSQVLSRKRSLSRKNILRVAEALGISPSETKSLLEKARASTSGFSEPHRLVIRDDEFKLMSDWYYFAILNLASLPACKAENRVLARRLGIGVVEVHAAVERLLRLGLVEKKGKYLRRTSAPLTTSTDIPKPALREFHKQHLNLGINAIDEVDVSRREVTTITVAIDPKNIPKAKKLIRKFRDDLGAVLEKGKRSEVYAFCMQLFPLTQGKST